MMKEESMIFIFLIFVVVFSVWQAIRLSKRKSSQFKRGPIPTLAGPTSNAIGPWGPHEILLENPPIELASVADGPFLDFTDERRPVAAELKLDDLYLSPVDGSLLGVNFAGEKIVLGSLARPVTYEFGTVVAVEIVRNGVVITQTNRGSQLVGAAVGGVALGGLGALAGGLTGSTRAKERLTGLHVKLTIDDRTHPIRDIQFLQSRSKKGLDPQSDAAKSAIAAAERFHGYILAGMRRAAASGHNAPGLDELERLWTLKEAGALTGDEFEERKSILLRGRSALVGPSVEPASWEARTVVGVLKWERLQRLQFITTISKVLPSVPVAKALLTPMNTPFFIQTSTPQDAQQIADMLIAVGVRVHHKQGD